MALELDSEKAKNDKLCEEVSRLKSLKTGGEEVMQHRITTKTLTEIKRLNRAGKNDVEVAELLGVHINTVGYWRHAAGLAPVRRHHRVKEYAAYDGKTEVLVAFGTAKECAAALDITVGTFKSVMSRAKHGAYKKYSFCEVEG